MSLDATVDRVGEDPAARLARRSAAEQLADLVRVRASTTGEDVVVRFAGEVHAVVPGEPARHLFGFDGFNVARAVVADGGWDLLAREAVYYLDPVTREPLGRWTNPWTGVEREVVHVLNDPVNFPLRTRSERGEFAVPTTALDGEVGVMTSDVFLAYPSPLPRAQYPDESQSDLYQAAELFQYFFRLDDLAAGLEDVPMQVSWTRIAPWVPFMGSGDRPGHLVYHCAGAKVEGGFAALPEWLRARVAADGPRFAAAPRTIEGRNATSWTHFRQLHPEGTA